jgi:hypothetical protein
VKRVRNWRDSSGNELAQRAVVFLVDARAARVLIFRVRAYLATTGAAADASMMPTTPGNAACTSAPAKIHPRTNLETRPPTLSFPVEELLEESNRDQARSQTCPQHREARWVLLRRASQKRLLR